jgi:prepilin-type N-terminal cleavage/methylation domain-containing protein
MKLILSHKLKNTSGTYRMSRGFSLAEVLAALTIGSMVMVAVLGIYRRAEKSVAAVTRRLDGSRLPGEVLQRIAEDLDNVVSSSSDVKITIDNKFENIAPGVRVPAARLIITRTIEDSQDKEQIFKEITWQSSYDFLGASNTLTLYRSAGGLDMEDKVLEKYKDDFEREAFVPICSGITFFNIGALAGREPIERWNGTPPRGIVITISFAEPYKKADGTFDVPEEEKITRTIAVDRTRKIRFNISATEDENVEEGQEQELGQGQENMDSPSDVKPPTKSSGKAEKVK